MFTKQLAISIAANKVLGCSNNVTIRLYDGCCFVLSILISFCVSEKNATSLPATKKESTNNTSKAMAKTAEAAGFIDRKKTGKLIFNTE